MLDQFGDLSIQAAFARGYIYKNGKDISVANKGKLKETIKKLLNRFSKEYEKEVSSDIHITNILQFADEITKKHRDILNSEFRIGTAQKVFNLYLKYLWCVGLAKPPHCPFDSAIYEVLRKSDRVSMKGILPWTKLNEKAQYVKLIENVDKARRNEESIAEWECRIWLEWKQKRSQK